jgi:uncharacterized protein (DUF2252 family)
MAEERNGKAVRHEVNRKSHAEFTPGNNRSSVYEMIQQSNEDRLEELIPVRHTRMSSSPFAFYRGTASIMAQDLSHLPQTNIKVQAIGDCHLMNFGGFASPERTLILDANDFDETIPASWEWDIKRLATSFVLAGRNISLRKEDSRELAYILTQSYRLHMEIFSKMNALDLWYMKFDLDTLRKNSKSTELKQQLDEAIAKAHKNTSEKIFYKITQQVMGKFEILDQPPLIYHAHDVQESLAYIHSFLKAYCETLQDDRRWLFDHFKVVDVALKVVGVGSVGTRCYVVLMLNRKEEPLFIQVKEARQSVLQPFTAPSQYAHNGQRVVEGQRLVQAASDIFLGWSTGPAGRHFYLRQLRDRKLAPDVEHFDKELLSSYAKLCGRMLARAHAKTGDGALIASYMGKSDVLDEAISKFALAYADQTERDYEDFLKLIKSGKLAKGDEPSETSIR